MFFFGVLPSGERFYTMELLRGATLEELVRRGPLAPSRVVTIGIQLCKALARLHARGVIHRDLKPANVFLLRGDRRRPGPRRDRIKLLDLGIAKLTAAFYTSDANATPPENRLRTRAGVILGTPGYIAPELLHGDRDPHPRQDVFALGVTLYKLATGASPYAHPHAAAVGDPPRPAPNLPRPLEQLLHTALAADPSARYQSIAELQDDLELIHAELTAIAGTREAPPRRPSNPATPRPRSSANRLDPPPLQTTREPAAPHPADPPARSREVASSSTTKSITRRLPWLVAAALALGWFASAHLLDTQPRALIARTHHLSSTVLDAARIALAQDSPNQHDIDTSISTPDAPNENPTSGTDTGGRVSDGRGATTIASAPASPARGPSRRLTRADILRALADRRATLDLCLPGDGPIDLRLVLAADGHLVRATLIPAGSTIAQQCIAEALADLRLPATGAPSTHTISLRER